MEGTPFLCQAPPCRAFSELGEGGFGVTLAVRPLGEGLMPGAAPRTCLAPLRVQSATPSFSFELYRISWHSKSRCRSGRFDACCSVDVFWTRFASQFHLLAVPHRPSFFRLPGLPPAQPRGVSFDCPLNHWFSACRLGPQGTSQDRYHFALRGSHTTAIAARGKRCPRARHCLTYRVLPLSAAPRLLLLLCFACCFEYSGCRATALVLTSGDYKG